MPNWAKTFVETEAQKTEGNLILFRKFFPPTYLFLFINIFLDNFMEKRSMDFMGTRVSYPQYLRLVAIQREVIRMDVTIRYHPYIT